MSGGSFDYVQEKELHICPITNMEFIFIKGGKFIMGDIWGDGYNNEKPAHEVEIDDFYMGKYPVTQGQWKKVMGDNPSNFRNCVDTCPVENVSWDDAQEFIKKLNSRTDGKYRLPYEAEWEYAASWGEEGKKNKWSGTDNKSELKDYAWYYVNSNGKTHSVGQKKPNALGLYDMSGNVWELCMDWYGENYYKESPKRNPTGAYSGRGRVMRGGSWVSKPNRLRNIIRIDYSPVIRDFIIGFRLVKTL